ncbi:hypothetical protein [Alcaligenes sp. SDU_A2]|uniref:hypothetical protein n=1 Tax=Alcaligenes sp. SDU_A2 TaxID=3136634 RepID=UPI00311F8609
MKYASEILGLMRPYPGRAFRMGQLVREATSGRSLTPAQTEAARKGVRRVLDYLIEGGHVERIGEGTRSTSYAWRRLGHEFSGSSCELGP